jgi:membrane-associated HD superfamily phosphohydrolase
MEEIVRSVTEHPLVAMAVGLSALMLAYFLFKSLLKLALILILVAVVISGYFYFRHPESRPANLKDVMEKVRVGAGKTVDQGKSAYEKSKELVKKRRDVYEKGKEWVDKGKTVLDKGIDKGKNAVEKGKETADDLRKMLGGEGDAGNRQKP